MSFQSTPHLHVGDLQEHVPHAVPLAVGGEAGVNEDHTIAIAVAQAVGCGDGCGEGNLDVGLPHGNGVGHLCKKREREGEEMGRMRMRWRG